MPGGRDRGKGPAPVAQWLARRTVGRKVRIPSVMWDFSALAGSYPELGGGGGGGGKHSGHIFLKKKKKGRLLFPCLFHKCILLLIIINSFYIALFSALEQTHCAHWHVILNE